MGTCRNSVWLVKCAHLKSAALRSTAYQNPGCSIDGDGSITENSPNDSSYYLLFIDLFTNVIRDTSHSLSRVASEAIRGCERHHTLEGGDRGLYKYISRHS